MRAAVQTVLSTWGDKETVRSSLKDFEQKHVLCVYNPNTSMSDEMYI